MRDKLWDPPAGSWKFQHSLPCLLALLLSLLLGMAVSPAHADNTEYLLEWSAERLFAPEEDIWEHERDDARQIFGNLDTVIGTGYREADDARAVDPPTSSVTVGGQTYYVIPSSIDSYQGQDRFGSSPQRCVVDSRGRWVTDRETIFRVLFSEDARPYLENMDRSELAGRVSTAADQLETMISSHRAAAAMDIVKQGLETYLATHIGGSVSLADLGPGFVEALEGVICRAEMARFRRELQELAGDLRSADPSSMSHEDISSLYMRIRDFRARVPALAEFGRQSFPGGFDTAWYERCFGGILQAFGGAALNSAISGLSSASVTHSRRLNSAIRGLASAYSSTSDERALAGMLVDVLDSTSDVYRYYSNAQDPMLDMPVNTVRLSAETGYISQQVGRADPAPVDRDVLQGADPDGGSLLLRLLGPGAGSAVAVGRRLSDSGQGLHLLLGPAAGTGRILEQLGISTEPNPRDPDVPVLEVEVSGRMDRSRFPEKAVSYVYALNQDQVPVGFRSTEITVEESADGGSWQEADFDFRAMGQASLPVNVSIVMDYSGSMSGANAIAPMESAVVQFIELMESSDMVEVIKFASFVHRVCPLTDDHSRAVAAVRAPSEGLGGGTMLWDAVVEACGTPSIFAVVALTDGNDGSDHNTVSDAVRAANSADLTVFTIGLGDNIDAGELGRVASSTGGTYYHSPSSAELRDIYTNIGGVFDNTYLIEWEPDPGIVASGGRARIRLSFEGTRSRVEDTVVFQY